MKNIAVIGHRMTIEPVVSSIERHFADIETVKVEFIDTEMVQAAIEYIKTQTARLDGIVFTGRKPCNLINASMNLTLPYIYIRHDRSILLQTLLEAGIKEGFDLRSVSCDSYEREEVVDAYKGFGIDEDELELFIPSEETDSGNLVKALFTFHRENCETGRASFCMTGVSMVYEKLREEGIPAFLMRPTTESVISGIRQLMNKINAINSRESQIVVISMEIDLPGEYNLVHENEYQLMLERTRVTEEVYKFAETIQAAVVEVGAHNYLLFSTRKVVEAATGHLQSMSLLKSVSDNSAHTMSIGVGYGKTVREAKYQAAIGLNRALSKGGNQAYSVVEGRFSDPIYPDADKPDDGGGIADPLFSVIARETGISINNIYKLQCIMDKLKKSGFTSAELAEEFGNTRRSMNRIIEKLERAGYAVVDGTRMLSDTGRPTRIIRLSFRQKD